MNTTRCSRLSWLGLLAATAVAGALLFHNVWGYTRLRPGGIWRNRPYDHGWPFTYLVRNQWIPTPSGIALNEIRWPWPTMPGMIREFSLPLLACNVVVALAITAATYLAVAHFARHLPVNRQYSLRGLFLVFLLAALFAPLSKEPLAVECFTDRLVPAIIWCGVGCAAFDACRWVYVVWPPQRAE